MESTTRVLRIRNGNFILTCTVLFCSFYEWHYSGCSSGGDGSCSAGLVADIYCTDIHVSCSYSQLATSSAWSLSTRDKLGTGPLYPAWREEVVLFSEVGNSLWREVGLQLVLCSEVVQSPFDTLIHAHTSPFTMYTLYLAHCVLLFSKLVASYNMHLWQSQVENEHYCGPSHISRMLEITPDFLCLVMND